MSRSPLAYPLNRSADTDIGGAADLQTDVMRFMAILALCLVAIFALVQSIPLVPAESQPEPVVEAAPDPQPEVTPVPATELTKPEPKVQPKPTQETVTLTRPAWVPRYPVEKPPAPPEPPAVESEEVGFTLRFASDAALARAVAAHHVGVYAISSAGAKRMTVDESRISFWDASTPNSFHEMEAGTVPAAVVAALTRAGIEPGGVNWGVTLPGKMTAQLNTLMEEHRGGSLIIAATGEIHWEAS